MEKKPVLGDTGKEITDTGSRKPKTNLAVVTRHAAVSIDKGGPGRYCQQDGPECPEDDGECGFSGIYPMGDVGDILRDRDEGIPIAGDLESVNRALDPDARICPDKIDMERDDEKNHKQDGGDDKPTHGIRFFRISHKHVVAKTRSIPENLSKYDEIFWYQ